MFARGYSHYSRGISGGKAAPAIGGGNGAIPEKEVVQLTTAQQLLEWTNENSSGVYDEHNLRNLRPVAAARQDDIPQAQRTPSFLLLNQL